MEWLQIVDLEQQFESKQIKTLKKWKQFTLYDHNSYIKIDQDQLTFTCVFNSKKINNKFSIIGKIYANFKTNQMTISNILTDNQTLFGGQLQYQKIQLARFAFRYNQRSQNNILIKVNPINGQINVCMNFMFQYTIFDDQQQFKISITDSCKILGDQSEKIFNTMMQTIFQRQANQPYLKSGPKVQANFPRYMKVQKLLDKVKTLIATSNHYKIKMDTSSAHKNRSYFKKLYLINDKKFIKDSQIQKLALLYQLKYNKVYQDANRRMKDRLRQFIRDYSQIQANNQIQFAKHLKQDQQLLYQSYADIKIKTILCKQSYQNKQLQKKKTIITNNKDQLNVLIDQLSQNISEKWNHLRQILHKLQFQHLNITKHYFDADYKNLKITKEYNAQSLQTYLQKNKKIISLSRKFDIMAQICHALQFLHKKFVGCFFKLQDFIVDQGFVIKLRNLQNSYAVQNKGWKQFNTSIVQNSGQNKQTIRLQIQYLMQNRMIQDFPYIKFYTHNNFKRDLINQKCDVFSLGILLYRILIDKFPFFVQSIQHEIKRIPMNTYHQLWNKLWTVQTEQFVNQGGQIVKLVTHLILKCFNSPQLKLRPYVQWITVILSQIKTSLNGLY